MSPSPDHTVVLVPGAMLGPWIWERLRGRLDAPTAVPDLPSRSSPSERGSGLQAAADELAGAVGDLAGRVVLVGHSLGGMVAWEAAGRLRDRVERIVLVGAEVPPAGRAWLDEQPAPARAFFRSAWALRPRGIRPPAFAARRALGNDLDDADQRRLVEELRPEPPGMYTEAVTVGELPGVPVEYVRMERDQALSGDRQQATAARVGARRVHRLDTGHLPMVSRPAELAEILAPRP